mmetsp:Transcript_72134/g.192795  ORF Transcript_72134/g.192795 Transcript_72134/m.192795 type:complete len:231 (+) Transcript_72134:851-1543(+)
MYEKRAAGARPGGEGNGLEVRALRHHRPLLRRSVVHQLDLGGVDALGDAPQRRLEVEQPRAIRTILVQLVVVGFEDMREVDHAQVNPHPRVRLLWQHALLLRAFVDEKDGAGEEVKLRLPLHHLLNVPQAFKKPWHQPSTNSSAIVKETLQSFTESLRVQFFASMFVHQLKFSVVDLVYTHTTDSGPQTSSGCNVVLIPAPTQFVRKPIRRSGGETHLYVQNAGLVIAIC